MPERPAVPRPGAAGPATPGAPRGSHHRGARPEDPVDLLVDSGLVDTEWVAAQLGGPVRSVHDAARAVVDNADLSPHPLFEPSWLPQRKPWLRTGQHPVMWYVDERRRRNRVPPHPLVSLRVVHDTMPEARFHDYGALAHWVSVATDDTPLPTRVLPEEVRWGDFRAAALELARERRHRGGRRRTRLVAPAPTLHRPDRPVGGTERDHEPLVSVVLAVRDRSRAIRATVRSLQAQSHAAWELVVVDQDSSDDTAAVVAGLAAFDTRVRLVREGRVSKGAALNAGLSRADGEVVTFLEAGRTWPGDHLATLVHHLVAHRRPVVHAGQGPVARDRRELLAGRPVDLAGTLVRREALEEVGGFDDTLGDATGRDLLLRLTTLHDLTPLDVALPRPPEAASVPGEPDWDSVVLERHLIDWDDVAAEPGDPDLVSWVVTLGHDVRRTMEWLLSPRPPGTELVAVGPRLRRSHHLLAATTAAVLPGVRFVPVAAELNANAAANVGVATARGERVVVVRPEAATPRVDLGPLVDALTEGVAVTQPVVVDAAGVVQSAGAVFVPGRPHPAFLLAGHALADAQRLGRFDVSAPASPVVAVRRGDLARLGGLDPRFRSAGSELDLGLRAAGLGLGRSVVVGETWLTSRAPYAEPTEMVATMALLAAGPTPPAYDDLAGLLRRAGFEVTDVRNRRVASDARSAKAPSVLVPEPVVRAARGIAESPPRLRWAIDIASPAAARGDRWGDTHFAASLADALERRGQHVAVDRRDARHRDSRDHDDVLLVLRGLDRVEPRPGLLNLEWIISHPDLVTPEEVAGFDQVYAASLSWSARVSREWGLRVEPLLQCTDSRRFNPDRGEPDTGPAVLFVGNSRGVYRFAVRTARAIGAPLTLHGTDWVGFVPREQIASDGVANDELGALYASAGVVLNDHHLDMRRDGFVSNRLFDAAACGARVVSDPVDGLEEIFGGLVRPFADEADLAELIAPPHAAFPDPEKRRAIAEQVVATHSFDERAARLVDDAVDRLRRRDG